ncbi:hypothetical protein [Sulfitobacter sp. PS-8MA]|uniref:hypothetical protein n=1 Tax=Sulfitobacter sp. PS-8MA TaxID=3237707 RepID=UPI0034C657B7
MTQAAEIICYIQPVTAQAAGTAWVDTAKTASVRRTVTSKREAVKVIEEAKEIATAITGKMVVKTMARAIAGSRRPAGVKALQGSQVVA